MTFMLHLVEGVLVALTASVMALALFVMLLMLIQMIKYILEEL